MTKLRASVIPALFDPIPLVPKGHFVKENFPHREVWYLVGPTINANRSKSLQELFCIAFVEGMRMAVSNLKDTESLEQEIFDWEGKKT